MAETVEGDHNASFWLPTHFLTDEDFLPGDDPTLKKEPMKTFDLFSNGFDPFGPPSALDSPVSSSETEPERDDHEELLAELTRQLAQSTLHESRYRSNPAHNTTTEKPWLFSTSPQSTLTGFGPWSNRSGLSSNGSPNGPSQAPSPPLTPPGTKNDAAWELLYEAAGQVARLKMNGMAAAQMNHNQQTRGLLGGPRNPPMASKCNHPNGFYDFPHNNQFQAVKRQGSSTMWGQGRQEREEWNCEHHHPRRSCGGGGALGLPQSAWPPLSGATQPHHHHHNHRQQQCGGAAPAGMRAVFLGGSGLGTGSGSGLKKSAGTGVFLPRRPGTQHQPAEPRRKAAGGSPVLLPARVVQALNLDLQEMNNGVNPSSQSRFGCGFVTDHDMLMARRNSQMVQQRSLRRDGHGGATMVGHEVCLPSDWTY
ncbi:hypothetical protein Cgig2_005747 [Carnegiea gigantea]|uniref:Uncharacterized protein n=1 Tax=Carnegiea gigantea TaxID=171969 RepID=A0A9Q1KI02_9CARY|nr:hypothetical protein Cgig2_005747 [Carnegiea gigantea]